MLFWIFSLLMLAAAVLSVLLPLTKRYASDMDDVDDVGIYREQLVELESRKSRNELSTEAYDSERAEIGRRILRAKKSGVGVLSFNSSERHAKIIASLFGLVLVPIVAVGGYLFWGNPGMQDHPIALQQQTNLGDKSIEEMVRIAERHLSKNPDDAKGWQVLADVYGRLNRPSDRANVLQQIIRLSGPNATRLAELGEALTVANGNIVSGRARKLFEDALNQNAEQIKARVYLAIAAEQEGKIDQAITIWKSLSEKRKADPNWQGMVNQRLDVLGKKVSAGGKITKTPSKEEIETISGLPTENRQAVINSMVDGLAKKLSENPNNIDGWLQLIRSYHVLGQVKPMKNAVLTAQQNFRNSPADMEKISNLLDALSLTDKMEKN